MVVQMIAVGEESGSLDTMSAKVAEFYEAEVDNAVDSMSSLMEPMIMAILGVLVGGWSSPCTCHIQTRRRNLIARRAARTRLC